MKFNIRIDDLELRSCGEHLTMTDNDDRAEVVKWETHGKEYCYTIAYWNIDKEGYDIKFVGNRFIDVDSVVLMKLLKNGQQILDDLFESE